MTRTAIVTGGASGIGRATVELLRAQGVQVAVFDRHGDIPTDVADAASVNDGVTANCVCPGATLTGMTEAIPAADRQKFARRHVPVGRYGRPEEIAWMIVSLTAEEASFVNGAVIAVDGGMTARGR